MNYDFELPNLPFDIHGGRYNVTSLIAEGGTARVYVCYDTQTRTWRAVKMLLPEYASLANLRTRLITEASAMKHLDHPHITKVFEAFEDEENAYFVMEYAERGSVGDWVRDNGCLPPAAAIEVMIHVCRAVAHAHDSGVVHRDIKPQNILVDGRGVCTVADFGIAQITFAQRLTRTGAALGTLGYIAPEQLDSAKHVDGRADIYSIGAAFFNLLTANRPRDLFMHKAGDSLFASIPNTLVDIIVACTRHKCDDRIQNVTALLERIEKAQLVMTPLGSDFSLLCAPAVPPIPPGLRASAIRSSRIDSGSRHSPPPTFDVDAGIRTVTPGGAKKNR
jgi:serine/threonine protein kinase